MVYCSLMFPHRMGCGFGSISFDGLWEGVYLGLAVELVGALKA